ncbi:sodium/sugar symporter [Govanella unica]|uniref:Sodium/sugar symporter n=1 Tax=Govanella unica TaxID=2975056 RepID=A0A9X3TW40_9PROT|nr:sodium/sugar symporter [Govania unica]MDA5192821.1 sodium/sugar symporter [Govania unica]
MQLATIDIVIISIYAIAIIAVAQWVSRDKKGHKKDSKDYFLASKSLPWWAVGTSLIAANISAEQIIGMSGSGFAIGLAIASYEWMAAITLIIVGKYFLPIFLREGIYTMPQYLERRYGHSVRMVMAIFWLGVYVFVNLTSILWLGALAIHAVSGVDVVYSLVLLGALAAAYSLYGGLKAVALTAVVQVALLVMGGLIITWLALDHISGGAGPIAGFIELTHRAPEKFHMILSPDDPNYISLPGLSVLLGGMWVMNISYWGCNQDIIQRALGAKSVKEAQKGVVLAVFLKLLMPIFVVLPGIAAAVIAPDLGAPDLAYPEMMKLVPSGIKGLVFAALIAAIVSALGSLMNSISTIFTMDLYRHFKPQTEEQNLVKIGRSMTLLSITLAVIVTKPLLSGFDQAFQFIQEFTGFFTPGIVVLFLLGLFWKHATAKGGLAAAIGSAVLSAICKIWWPELPFMDRVGLVFLACLALAVTISLADKTDGGVRHTNIKDINFQTSSGYNFAALSTVLVLTALYTTWW